MSKHLLKEIFLKAVSAVQPQNLVRNAVKLNNGHLAVKDHTYPIHKPCYIVGFGKAVLGMTLEMEKILGDNLQTGIVMVPQGIFNHFTKPSITKIRFIEGALNNLPDENAMTGANKIKDLIETLTTNDLLIVLISGGGSGLLPIPQPPVTLEEKLNLIKNMALNGANISELNCVRKHISVLKGGGLAELAYPATMVSLIISDVVGDPLDYIASGPTVPNMDSTTKAMDILKKYLNHSQIPETVHRVLKQPQKTASEIAKYSHVDNFIIGNNEMASEAARLQAIALGFQTVVVSTTVTSDVMKLAEIYVALVKKICNSSTKILGLESLDINDDRLMNLNNSRPICLIAAGEPTLIVRGNGKGGRNQHLALAFAIELNKLNIKSYEITFLSCGTDGIDGPTDAAGAISGSHLMEECLEQDIDSVLEYLDENDSYNFFSRYNSGKNLIKIGHTGTNVMDIHLIAIQPKDD